MKNRKILIAAFLSVAMLVTGIGYAAVSGFINIIGTATFDVDASSSAFIENIVFSNPSVAEKEPAIDGAATAGTDVASALKQTAEFTIKSLATKGDSTTFLYDIKNYNKVDANVTVVGTANNPLFGNTFSEFFRVDSITLKNKETNTVTSFVTNNNTLSTEAIFNLAAGQTAELSVTVSLIKTPTANIVESDGVTYSLSLTATAAE